MSATPELLARARECRENSYSPYSRQKVGAAIRTASGKIYAGCNVENSSYGGTICAERTAIGNAVAAEGRIQIKELVVVTDATPPWPPCGICRQAIAEFSDDRLPIHCVSTGGAEVSFTRAQIFPSAFTPAHLGK